MHARVTCRHCGREFLFFQLYNAGPGAADRCPHCSRHLGVLGVRSLALRIDWAAAELMRCLTEMAARDPQFTIEPESVLGPIGDVVAKLTTSDADNRIRLGNAAAVTFDVNGSAAPVGDGAPSPSTVVFTT